ncbi:transcriptional regulator [Halomonas heilongjiangensis]|uniref:Transcriptional regulator n=2 Tax=Halomonas heilongjiangensis TaxID=1387883 RepID=A0A2N7THN4_9GAMM|nr:transcriptional regulator [Halomonas heilongjiangensis]PXX87577.1 transcriptional regulator [Halomonas heilongjiangensis]
MTLLEPVRFFKCLADDTRLMLLLLIQVEEELCVCEMTHALEQSQPKVSRHLAQLRRCGLLNDRREGQWVYYSLAPGLPGWAITTLQAAAQGEAARLGECRSRLGDMGNRPERRLALC